MITPTSRFIPIETKITRENWLSLPDIIKRRKKELRRLKDAEEILWFMSQLEYIKAMYEYHKSRFCEA